ncbi:MAG: energy-coupling factor transporter transmembrane component T [Anaerolineaceae bacterium]|nr:energy-coupling factor transporter transmembrane component T [Anaerolineaceae bacterium]
MSQFEFLPLVTIGQYLPTDSVLNRLDARIRVIIFSGLLLALTFTPSLRGLILGLAFLLLGLFLARIPIRYALKGLLPPLPFMLFIVVLQVLFFSSQVNTLTYFAWGPIHITLAGLWAALQLLLRFMALILCLSLASFCTSTSELITGMDRLLSPLNRLGIQTMDFVMAIQVAIRFLPLLAQSAERIAKAQASRGAEWGMRSGGILKQARQIVPLIVPLILTSLRRAESLALAMDARAYGLKKDRTSLYQLTFTHNDAIFLVIGLAAICLIILL